MMEEIINRHLKSVYNFIYRLTNDQDATEDIVQETFIKVWKKFKEDKNLKPWIFKVARNTAVDYLRKRKNVLFSEIDSKNDYENSTVGGFEEKIEDLEPLPDEIFQRKELAEELNRALEKIRSDFREIVFLHYVENLTFQEISEIIDKPINTVKSWHRRAIISLQKFFIE